MLCGLCGGWLKLRLIQSIPFWLINNWDDSEFGVNSEDPISAASIKHPWPCTTGIFKPWLGFLIDSLANQCWLAILYF